MSNNVGLLVLDGRPVTLDSYALEVLASIVMDAVRAGVQLTESQQRVADVLLADARTDSQTPDPVAPDDEPGDIGGRGRAATPLLLSRAEAARLLGIGETKLRELDRPGGLSPKRIDGRVLYRRSDIEEYADDG